MSGKSGLTGAEKFLKSVGEKLELEITEPARSLLDLEICRPRLLKIRVEAYNELVTKREQARMPNYKPDPKDKSTPRYTDFDRKIMLDNMVADYESLYELARGLEKLVCERVELLRAVVKEI